MLVLGGLRDSVWVALSLVCPLPVSQATYDSNLSKEPCVMLARDLSSTAHKSSMHVKCIAIAGLGRHGLV